MRPNSTVPNTTSARPETRASNLREGLVAQARRAHPKRPRPRPQTPRQGGIEIKPRFLDARAIALHIHKTEGGGRFGHAAQHRPEERFMLRLAHPQARLRHEVAERQWRRKPVFLAQKMRSRLIHQDFQRGMVQRQMVHQQKQQPALLGGVASKEAAHQRRVAHIEPVLARIEARAQLLGDIARRRVKGYLFHAQRRLAPHHLHRLGQAFPDHRRAQNVVPGDHRLQRPKKALKPLARIERQQDRHQIGVALRRDEMMEQ